MKLYFVRHPQTLWNVKRLFQGIKEGGVSEEGKIETLKFIKNLNVKKIDVIYCGNNNRCKYLAKKIFNNFPNSSIIIDSRLNERSFGDLEGTSELEFSNNSDFVFPNMEAKYKWRPKNGESLEDVSTRVKDFLSEIKIRNIGKSIFIITSGGVMKVITYLLSIKTLKEAMEIKYKNLEILEVDS